MSEPHANANGTQRGLSKRHVQMIAVGGTIGTGLFLGAGTSISKTGPSILMVYGVLGLFFFWMMRGIGEMLYADPEQHTFVAFIGKYISPAAGYFAGWAYWLGLLFIGMSELTAIANYVHYWFPHVSGALVQVGFLGALLAINIVAVKFFGETEYWFAIIKIVAILAMIATGLCMVFTGFKAPASSGGGVASFGNVFSHFEFFPNGWQAFLAAFPMVFFAFLGIEFVGITTAETKNPRAVLPKAINTIIFRILFFYIGVMVVIMSIMSWHEIAKTPNESPFVSVFQLAGFNAAAAVINFIVLTSAASALNSALYSAGRHFYQLAEESRGKFLSSFATISKSGVPAKAVIFSAVVLLLSPIISLVPQITSAFLFITGVTSNMYIIVYTLTMIAHRRYRASQDFMADGFKMPGYRITSPLTIAFFGVMYLSLLMEAESRWTALVGLIFAIVFGGWIYYRDKKA